MKSLPSQATNGPSSCSRSLFSGISMRTESGSAAGSSSPAVPRTKPSRGSSSASGAVSRTLLPSGAVRVSVSGLNSRVPASASAMTMSGLVMNDSVEALPSLRPGKFRLNELTMVLVSSALMSVRFHCPMQGPQALASTVPPILVNVSTRPSRLTVWKTRSEPGVTRNVDCAFSPAFRPWVAMWAARRMSS